MRTKQIFCSCGTMSLVQNVESAREREWGKKYNFSQLWFFPSIENFERSMNGFAIAVNDFSLNAVLSSSVKHFVCLFFLLISFLFFLVAVYFHRNNVVFNRKKWTEEKREHWAKRNSFKPLSAMNWFKKTKEFVLKTLLVFGLFFIYKICSPIQFSIAFYRITN